MTLRCAAFARAVVLSALIAGSATAQGPSGAWPVGKPAAVGLNPAVFDSLDAEIRAGTYGYIDRMVVIRHGQLVVDQRYQNDYEAIYGRYARERSALNPRDMTGPFNYFATWWHPFFRRGELHTLQSVTKTITSVVIGTAVMRGDFPSIDTPVLRFFDTTNVANIDARKRRMTVRHLLTMTGGFAWNEGLPYFDPNNSSAQMEASPDWIQYTIDRPMEREPGTQFNYSSGESALLAHVFRQATGRDVEDYAAQHLFAPLGITQWYWKRSPSGSLDTEGGLYLDPRDVARIWQLWLQGGVWQGTRLLTADWVRQSVTPAIATSSAPNAPQYGYLWWLYQDPLTTGKYIWGGSGFGGQVPMAFPDLDLVVVFNAWNILPGQKTLPAAKVRERIARAVVGK